MKKIVSFTLVGIMLILTLFVASCGGDTKVEFKVNFVVDGEIYSTINTSGEEVIAIPQNPTKEGYTFDGWYWDDGKWQRPFTANSLLNEPLSSDMSVYAKWTEINVEPEQPNTDISSSVLEVNGEIATATVSNATTTFSFLNDIKVADGASYILANDIGCQNVIASKTVALEEGDNTYYLLVTNDTAQKLYTVTIRRRPIYTIEFNTNGGTSIETLYIEEDNTVDTQETSKTGYTFVGWTLNNEAVSFPYTVKENTTFNAQYTVITYTIEYNLNNGINNSENVSNYTIEQMVALKNPTRDYYLFDGWFETADFSGTSISEFAQGTTENKILYAKWIPVQYEIEYELNGGINNESNVFTYNVEQEIKLSDPTKYGYTFMGWYLDDAFTDNVEKISLGSSGNKKLFALWKPTEYLITYHKNGGTENIANPNSFTIEDLPIALNDLNNKTDYLFDYWYSTDNFSGDPVFQINDIGDIDLYASYINMTTGISLTDYNGEWTVSRYIGESNMVTISSKYKGKLVTRIENNAFSECSNLTNISIPSTINTIGQAVFSGCNSLECTNYDNALYLGNEENPYVILLKAKNTTITSCIINEKTKCIYDSAFAGCTELTNIIIPNNISSIGDGSFFNCTSLKYNEYDSALYLGNKENPYVLLVKANNNNIVKCNISEKTKFIHSYAFSTCNSLTDIVLPDSVSMLGSGAFDCCRYLKNISLSKNLISIGSGAFFECKSLRAITLPDNVKSISYGAFQACTSLYNIYIPSSVMYMDAGAIAFCQSLRIYCEATEKPIEWDLNWNYSNSPVEWGYKEN